MQILQAGPLIRLCVSSVMQLVIQCTILLAGCILHAACASRLPEVPLGTAAYDDQDDPSQREEALVPAVGIVFPHSEPSTRVTGDSEEPINALLMEAEGWGIPSEPPGPGNEGSGDKVEVPEVQHYDDDDEEMKEADTGDMVEGENAQGNIDNENIDGDNEAHEGEAPTEVEEENMPAAYAADDQEALALVMLSPDSDDEAHWLAGNPWERLNAEIDNLVPGEECSTQKTARLLARSFRLEHYAAFSSLVNVCIGYLPVRESDFVALLRKIISERAGRYDKYLELLVRDSTCNQGHLLSKIVAMTKQGHGPQLYLSADRLAILRTHCLATRKEVDDLFDKVAEDLDEKATDYATEWKISFDESAPIWPFVGTMEEAPVGRARIASTGVALRDRETIASNESRTRKIAGTLPAKVQLTITERDAGMAYFPGHSAELIQTNFTRSTPKAISEMIKTCDRQGFTPGLFTARLLKRSARFLTSASFVSWIAVLTIADESTSGEIAPIHNSIWERAHDYAPEAGEPISVPLPANRAKAIVSIAGSRAISRLSIDSLKGVLLYSELDSFDEDIRSWVRAETSKIALAGREVVGPEEAPLVLVASWVFVH